MSVAPYAPPSIGPAGLTVNNYQSILQDNLQSFLNIFGQNQYIAPDSAIYQLLSILSLKQADQNLGLQLVYNQSSPQTAVGAGLDREVKMNGLARAPFTFSTATLTCVGTAGLPLINCFAQDQAGNLWSIPTPTPITGGSVNVVATCTTPGAVAAEPGQISIISTPTAGWTSVTNANAATAGEPVESDSSLRARQSVSVALPALTPIAATVAAVLAVKGVVRVAPGYKTPAGPGSSIENPTGGVDSWGNPAHSISIVADGGTDLAVATAIYLKKTIGCLTNGTTSAVVTDQNTGFEETISFFRPTDLPIFVLAAIHGYNSTPTTATLAAVQAAIVLYLNSLQIGETVPISAVNYEAMSVNANLSAASFGVQSLAIGTLTASTTADTTLGSNSITVADPTGIVDDQLVVSSVIPAGTTVTGVVGSTISLSANATATATGVAAKFATLGTVDIPMTNFHTVSDGIAANVAVVTV